VSLTAALILLQSRCPLHSVPLRLFIAGLMPRSNPRITLLILRDNSEPVSDDHNRDGVGDKVRDRVRDEVRDRVRARVVV